MNTTSAFAAPLYTVQDYLAWDDESRWELIEGVAYNMSPAPSVKHHDLSVNLYSFLRDKLKGKPCKPFIAPVDVILSERDVVQPDVFVVCDPCKINDKDIQGTPDFIAEVLSPGTSRKDLREKKALISVAACWNIWCLIRWSCMRCCSAWTRPGIMARGKFSGRMSKWLCG